MAIYCGFTVYDIKQSLNLHRSVQTVYYSRLGV